MSKVRVEGLSAINNVLRQLPKGSVVIFAQDRPPIRAKRLEYYRYPWAKRVASLAAPKPQKLGVLEELPLAANSDDFVFDNQMLVQAHAFGFRMGEISCPTRYFPEASQINFRRSVVYGLGVLRSALAYRLWKWKFAAPRMLSRDPGLRLGGREGRTQGGT